jgi:flagellar basal body-associated protein FliL
VAHIGLLAVVAEVLEMQLVLLVLVAMAAAALVVYKQQEQAEPQILVVAEAVVHTNPIQVFLLAVQAVQV